MGVVSKQDEMVQAAFDGVAVPMVIIDRGRRVLRCNLAMSGILGISPSAAVGQTCCSQILGPDEVCPDCIARRAMASGRTESRAISLDGVSFRLGASPIVDGQGVIVGAVHTLAEMTALVDAGNSFHRWRAELNNLILVVDHLILST